jgi:hypothetical protein
MSRSMDQTNFEEWRENKTKQRDEISLTREISWWHETIIAIEDI